MRMITKEVSTDFLFVSIQTSPVEVLAWLTAAYHDPLLCRTRTSVVQKWKFAVKLAHRGAPGV